jgi:hypothetical protein
MTMNGGSLCLQHSDDGSSSYSSDDNEQGRKKREKQKGKAPIEPQVSKAGKKIKRAAERENEP